MTKLELPKLFKHYHEIEGRDGFNPSCGVTLDNFQSLIGEYHFSEEVRCQVRKSDGNCGNNHLHGWLGLTKEGKEGLIGWLCAVKYFNADKTFAIERNRVRKEISISSSLASLNNLLTNRDVFEQTIETQMSRIRFLRDSVKSLESRLLPSVIKTVSDMEKTGNRAVYSQIQYVEVDEEGKKNIEWIDQRIGNISGTPIWLYSNLGSIFSALKEIKNTLSEVELSRESGERKLKKWANTLSSLPNHASQIDELQREYELFSEFNNLTLLIFLVRDQKDQLMLSKVALEHNGINRPSNNDGRRLIKQLENQIRNNNGNRNFKVPR